MEIESMIGALQDTPEGWIKFLAINNAKIVRSPLTETGYAIRRSYRIDNWDKHLFGRKTRDHVIRELLEAYGDIDNINRLIEGQTR